jgi:uncharacterized protein
MKGIALDPLAWQPLIEAQSDWFEVIHLYGTEGGWNKLKTLADAHEDADARHQAFVDRIAPATWSSGIVRASGSTGAGDHAVWDGPR